MSKSNTEVHPGTSSLSNSISYNSLGKKRSVFTATFLYLAIAVVYIVLFSLKIASIMGMNHTVNDWLVAIVYFSASVMYIFLTISHRLHKQHNPTYSATNTEEEDEEEADEVVVM